MTKIIAIELDAITQYNMANTLYIEKFHRKGLMELRSFDVRVIVIDPSFTVVRNQREFLKLIAESKVFVDAIQPKMPKNVDIYVTKHSVGTYGDCSEIISKSKYLTNFIEKGRKGDI